MALIMIVALASGASPQGSIAVPLIAGSAEMQSVVEQTVNESYSNQSQINNEGRNFSAVANAKLGKWKTYVEYQPTSWNPGARVKINVTLSFHKELLNAFLKKYQNIEGVCILLTAERDFDAKGLQRVPWNQGVSTLLTPGGLPIEGGGSSAVSRFAGYSSRTPVDIMLEAPLSSFHEEDEAPEWLNGTITASFYLPKDLPPGIYRLRLDYGFKAASRWYNLNGDDIGVRPKDLKDISCLYSPPITSSGKDVTGEMINGSQIKRRTYWVLLNDYNSNGYQGAVAQEDRDKIALSPRHIIHDEVVLPLIDDKGETMSYNLEPDFLIDGINSQHNIPLRYDSGEWSVKLTLPNGTEADFGRAGFVEKKGNGATTKEPRFTNWQPPSYGRYVAEAKGWIEDIWGNRYEAGGNYSFWIAKRLTIATATFPGQSYNVGNRYGRDIAFFPAVPANVTIEAKLYVNSDPNDVRTMVSMGNATVGGIFGAPQGMKFLPLDAAGEYLGRITATYWDQEGNLWVEVMTHAGIVYPEDTSIIAHGKKILSKGRFADRGGHLVEGYISDNGTLHADYLNFPYNSMDVMLIAGDQQGANMIVPVLTYEVKGKNSQYDQTLHAIERSNLRIRTSNGLSPYLFPEYITDMAYFYASAARPGFMSRFVVAEDNAVDLFWPTGMSNFGGQFGASNNGDQPGIIFRLLGGVVLRQKGQSPEYARYQASAFILPKGADNNRVIGPGDEDLPSPDGKPARFFLVPVRPGSVYQLNSSFTASLMIDPVVACNVQISMIAPDGSRRTTQGKGDRSGYFTSQEKWSLDQPGVWIYNVNAIWNGHQGRVPGFPDEGGYLFVLENGKPDGIGMTLNLSGEQVFSPMDGLEIHGNSSASKVYYTAITPGAILDEGILPVANGQFTYKFDPIKMSDRIKTYDIINLTSGKPEIGRIVHLTFFSEEKGASGPYHSFAKVILRGNKALYVKER